MVHRRLIVALALGALALPTGLGAQPTASHASALPGTGGPGTCAVLVDAVQVAPGRYAVEIEDNETLEEVDVRVDAVQGHWLFRVSTPEVVLQAPVPSGPVNVTVVGTRRPNAALYACDAAVHPLMTGDPAQAVIDDARGAPLLQPFDSRVDPPMTCAKPFARATTVHTVQPIMPAKGRPGIVLVRVDLDADSHIVNAAIYSSEDPALDAESLRVVRASTFQTQVFRCVPLPASYLFGVEYN
ncbi:MAG TPA: hypothetical protein VMD91_16325 [Candidatus Sulfotelmatobacter sp.]|nr:hypothetical protein [Candidatus Sulfotelmatobacter sp.]